MALLKINPVWDTNKFHNSQKFQKFHILSDSDIHWDFEQLKIKSIWEKYKVQGENVNVFVIDTGIDASHKAFKDTKIYAKSFIENESPMIDVHGHGTWCCGKIVGKDVGISPNCILFSAKVMDANGEGSDEDINNALSWALDNSPHVVSMSIGGYNRDKTQENLCNKIFAKGGIIVAAAGNDNTGEKSYPAAFKNVLAVTAVDKDTSNAYFSNYGQHIAVAAPGVSCYSTMPNNKYSEMSGTSMATPIVAGLISLGISYIFKKKKVYGVSERDLIIKALEESAVDLGEPGFDIYYGHGGVNGLAFMEYIQRKIG